MTNIRMLLTALVMLAGSWSTCAQGVILVNSYGETGWQTFSYTFTSDFSGYVGIGVSDQGSTINGSQMLIDNLQGMGQANNSGFELGNFGGYTLAGTGSIVSAANSYAGNVYNPTEGGKMAILTADGVNMSMFGGTDGAGIVYNITATTGDEVSFDWAFLAQDALPYEDFSFLVVFSAAGQPVQFESLAKIGRVSEPASVALIGLGLVGFAMARSRKAAG